MTLRVYEGIPLTQIAREVGTSVRMIEEHYAGVIANWDGKARPRRAADPRAARAKLSGREMDAEPKAKGEAKCRKSLLIHGKPSVGLEPTTPSLPWKCSTS